MIYETLHLRPENPAVTLTAYAAENTPKWRHPPRPAVLVFPGGGYQFLTDSEAEPVAIRLSAAGFQTFVLRYSLGENASFPHVLQDASMAAAHVRKNAQRYNVDPERVFVLGFSAGGHLAAMLGTMYNHPAAAFPGMEPGINRPTGMILCYAPVAVDTEKIRGYFRSSIGAGHTEEELCSYAPERMVTADTPPAYIWHTFADPTVPAAHSLRMAAAMSAAGVPFEMHIFSRGSHGISLASPETNAGRPFPCPETAQWMDEAIEWIKKF